MHELAELMEKVECLDELKEKLVDCFKGEVSSKGLEHLDASEAGEVVDMIKDLAEAKKYCMEALYYQKVTEAMTSYEEPRYGYTPNQMSRTGDTPRFMLHTRYTDYDRDMTGPDYMREAMGDGRRRMDTDRNPRYGQAYNEYKEMRKHYTVTKRPEDKHEMDTHAEEHVQDTIATIRDIWSEADPALKKRMKEDFTRLLGEMTV